MIVATLSDPQLLASVRRAARPDEDVVGGARGSDALRLGFPRAVIESGSPGPGGAPGRGLPTLTLDRELLGSWDDERRWGGPEVPPERTEYVAFRVRTWLRTYAGGPTWVDGRLRDLGRLTVRPLPLPLRGMARRVLEFPARYRDLRALAGVVGLSAGALKARFRRRRLPSPHVYLRWLRTVAVAELLADPGNTTLHVAHRLGISSSGNLCRMVHDTAGLKPSELRAPEARLRLLTAMVEVLLGGSALADWDDLADLFFEAA